MHESSRKTGFHSVRGKMHTLSIPASVPDTASPAQCIVSYENIKMKQLDPNW
jgi:hypothetical protein